MGIMVTKQDDNAKMTDKINADLRTKRQSTMELDDKDFVGSSDYLKETEKTGKFSWVWAVLIILAIISLCIIIWI